LTRARAAFGKKAIGAITPPDVLALIRKIEAEGKHETASRVRLYVEKVFEYAQAVGKHAGNNPAEPIGSRGVMAPKPRVIHHTAMSFDQLPLWLARLDAASFAFEVKAALRFTLLTAMRTGEVLALQWKHIRGDKLTLPAELMKGRRAHTVHLSKPVRTLLDAFELIYACEPEDRVFDLSNMAMLMALKRTLPEGVEATVHGFRSTFSTWAHTMGAREAVVERCLAHANGDKVAAAYNRATFEADAAALWDQWATAVTK
jgi:integrase